MVSEDTKKLLEQDKDPIYEFEFNDNIKIGKYLEDNKPIIIPAFFVNKK